MARFNQFSGRNGGRHGANNAARKRSLIDRGVDLVAVQSELGCGEKRAMAEAERRLGIRWQEGRFHGEAQGHVAGRHA